MQKSLDKIIENYKKSRTSLGSYQAISDFVKIVLEVPKFIAKIEKEADQIHRAQVELNADKDWHHGLSWREAKEFNNKKHQKYMTLHQLDLSFSLRNLHDVHMGIQPDNIISQTDWLFPKFSPDDPLPEVDKKEY